MTKVRLLESCTQRFMFAALNRYMYILVRYRFGPHNSVEILNVKYMTHELCAIAQ